ncbi:MAG: class I SAM-dependent methyltransferase [Desulfobacterales bacterium]|nr:class I SAM-dependent methyltransferase [Desulfobacterales bacterium]
MDPNDLTTAAGWDRGWSRRLAVLQKEVKGLTGLVRRRTRQDKIFDATLTKMIDAADKPEASVIELGCAPGSILMRIHRLRPRYQLSGLDYSKRGLEIARDRFKNSGLDVALFEEDVRKFSPPELFDIVLSFGLIEHYEDALEILKYHKRLAKPGGLVAVTIPNRASWPVRWLNSIYKPGVSDTLNLEIMREEALLNLFLDAGLQHVSIRKFGSPQIPSTSHRKDISAKAYSLAAKGFNIVLSSAPFFNRLWPWGYYGYGFVEDGLPHQEREMP